MHHNQNELLKINFSENEFARQKGYPFVEGNKTKGNAQNALVKLPLFDGFLEPMAKPLKTHESH